MSAELPPPPTIMLEALDNTDDLAETSARAPIFAESRIVDGASAPSIEERLTVLETRTAPKPRTVLDRAKDYGGILSLLIAVAYTFPLGVWDRFFASERVRAAQEVASLRAAIDESAQITATAAQAMSAVSDPTIRDALNRSFSTRLYILMAKNRDAFERRLAEFVPSEQLLIGYNFASTNQIDAALVFFKAAESAKDDRVTQVESHRLHAKSLFLPGPTQNREEARRLFDEGKNLASAPQGSFGISAYLTLLADWGLLELLDGDWACGETQLAAVRTEYQRLGGLLGDRGAFLNVLEQQRAGLFRRPEQPAVGCQG